MQSLTNGGLSRKRKSTPFLIVLFGIFTLCKCFFCCMHKISKLFRKFENVLLEICKYLINNIYSFGNRDEGDLICFIVTCG